MLKMLKTKLKFQNVYQRKPNVENQMLKTQKTWKEMDKNYMWETCTERQIEKIEKQKQKWTTRNQRLNLRNMHRKTSLNNWNMYRKTSFKHIEHEKINNTRIHWIWETCTERQTSKTWEHERHAQKDQLTKLRTWKETYKHVDYIWEIMLFLGSHAPVTYRQTILLGSLLLRT